MTVDNQGCPYFGQDSRGIMKLTNADGTCDAIPFSPAPSINISPVGPTYTRLGDEIEFVAELYGVENPAGVTIVFEIQGENAQVVTVQVDHLGRAVFAYKPGKVGIDFITARAQVIGSFACPAGVASHALKSSRIPERSPPRTSSRSFGIRGAPIAVYRIDPRDPFSNSIATMTLSSERI